MVSRKLITVVMAAYNEEDRISEAIDSIINQTYRGWGLIIINDSSSDNTQEIIDSYVRKDSRIISIKNPRNMGLAYSLNRAISISDSTFIARMDADDISLPNRLQVQLDYMLENPDIDVLGTAAFVKNSNTDEKFLVTKPELHRQIVLSIKKINPFFHSSVLINMDFLKQLNGYDENFKRAQDYDLWLRGVDRHQYHNLAEPLLIYVERTQSMKSILYGFKVRMVNAVRRKCFFSGGLIAISVLFYGLFLKSSRVITNK